MTKPRVLTLGIGAAGAVCAALAWFSSGLLAAFLVWCALSCTAVSGAYLLNRAGVYGKRDGVLPWWRVLLLGPFLAAFWIAWGLRNLFRSKPRYHLVAPGLWVGARIGAAELPTGTKTVVDLTSELWEPAGIRQMPGYRNFPVLDGSYPHDEDAFLELLAEIADTPGGVYVHCESGRGRAPTMAALLLLARGVVDSPEAALELVQKRRPTASPTRADVAFIRRMALRVR
jgi:Swiss Army Knife protein, DSP-PTPase phosphatase domain